jgi:hypothetical protein
MEERQIMITEEQAKLLPLLYKVQVKADLENLPRLIEMHQAITDLVKRAREAFEKQE